ncbi:hypothetical protein TUM4438_10430 [Shewanella sairae]|uniref:DUF4400 domain-containing protein n=1 Tax=Shewanella sairae TaxID=190310 RepID=A0ABQ4P5Y0_9GAMM|nr:DUF4400 domain-containing protein [Shewanella sairae]MCL1130477.1 DUF4400 domain-containing protein [Shewanella sairae]GIU42869.1 hypothetical protein TUM4438_10430 [Shewanella sairae]
MPPKSTKKDEPAQSKKSQPTPWYLWPFQCVEYFFYAWLLLIIVEWTGHLWGWTVGEHARSVFFAQLALLQDDFPGLTQEVINYVLLIFEKAQMITNIEFVGFFAPLAPFWEGAVFATIALIARLIILASFYQIFLLALFVGFFDGLVVRQRRIAHLDREHVTIYYHSKRLLSVSMLLSGLAWLVLPGLWVIHPIWILLPSAIGVGILSRVVVSHYKKYL